ncbi:TIGR04086 family membrane protein [Clostridium botulinum]|uniref:TIGR04086 family membrane protein n=1 Tax=Clostridium TaxID=1485 RepID=UPI0005F98FAA|nr:MULTISPECIES: TIGR04086 family membrane protein [Clostridium]MBO0524442.1 TIGR04086 family membrane protein [Clostridium botulinum]MBO0527360.1 TIGR04086 family membrane protein [Clostridium botulinum]MBO0530350.1 TIGR04086 family membrane protein [Clostridium botulinum]MBO0536263.1 TIGR04086 family membrane protein [Clostridium botulinum]MBO0538427.1 TIGR04086 family membrane protein [Clostridium botulinum]
MLNKKNTEFIVQGLLRAIIITVIMLLIFAVILTFKDIGEKISSIIYLLITILSIMYGTIYAVRKINKKGWLIGLVISIMYMAIIYIISIVSGNTLTFGTDRFIRIFLALILGILSGMLGINI